MTAALFNNLECICPEGLTDNYPASYAHGCPRHTAKALATPTSASADVEAHTVTYFHATVRISNPVLKVGEDGTPEVWWTSEHRSCSHNHTTREAASRCAQSLAAQATR